MAYKTKSIQQVIKEKIVININTGCWEWTSSLDKDGYGVFTRKIPRTRKNKMLKAHRESYKVFKGSVEPGVFVMHTCDNRKCCSPEHLKLGTALDNNRDAIAKGRAYQAIKGFKKIK